MKKLSAIIFPTIIILICGYLIICSGIKNRTSEFAQDFNQYNVLAKREPKYIKINYVTEPDKDGYSTYYLRGYDRYSKAHDLEFTSDDDFKDGQYLKLDTKGSYVDDYQKVSVNGMPYKVYHKLHMQ